MEIPLSDTRFARSGGVHIAYQVLGDGPLDLVLSPGWVSHVELALEDPLQGSFLRRLASFARLIVFDKRGTGLSDRVPDDQLPTLEERMDDLRAVMDAVGSERAAIFGVSEGGNLAALFAATYPDRTAALAMFGTFAKRVWSPDYPWAPTPEARERLYEIVERDWGGAMDLATLVPSKVGDAEFMRRLATYLRRAASPGAALALLRMNTQIDIRNVLPSISAPTLVMHRVGDRDANIEEGRFIAARIPGRAPGRACGRGPSPLGRRCRGDRRRAPGVPDRHATGGGIRSPARHGAFHRHLRFDAARGRPRRPKVA